MTQQLFLGHLSQGNENYAQVPVDYGLWTPRWSHQSTPKEIYPEHSLGKLMLKLQYFDYLIRRADSLEKTPMLAKTEGKRIRGQQRLRWWDSITNSMNKNLSELSLGDSEGWESLACCCLWCWSWTGLSYWRRTKLIHATVWMDEENYAEWKKISVPQWLMLHGFI